jgi:hypothetical protein
MTTIYTQTCYDVRNGTTVHSQPSCTAYRQTGRSRRYTFLATIVCNNFGTKVSVVCHKASQHIADNMQPRCLHIVSPSPGMGIVLRSLVGQERKHEYSLAVARLTCTLPRQPYSCPARHADETSRIRMPAMRIHRRAKRNAARLEPPHIIVVLVVRRHALMSSAMPYESD